MGNGKSGTGAARVQAMQVIVVAAITGFVSIVTTLIATGHWPFDRPADNTSPGTEVSKSFAPVLDAPNFEFGAKNIRYSLHECMEKARNSVENTKLTGQEEARYYVWGYRGNTVGMIWCHTDKGIAIFMAAGGNSRAQTRQVRDALRKSF